MNVFPREKRLTTASSFQHVFRRGRKITLPDLYLIIGRNTLPYSRIGLAISKKNIPTAVGRNRVKRIIRESFRQRNDFSGLDVVVVARKNLSVISKQQLRENLDCVWKKLNGLYVPA